MFLYVWHVRLIYALNYYLLTYLLKLFTGQQCYALVKLKVTWNSLIELLLPFMASFVLSLRTNFTFDFLRLRLAALPVNLANVKTLQAESVKVSIFGRTTLA